MFTRKITMLATAILLSAAAAAAAAQAGDMAQLFGASAPAATAQRDIKIGPMTRYINVDRAETVRFVTDQGSFAWSFDTAPNRTVFDFGLIAPSGIKADGIRVFVGEPTGGR